MSTITTRPHQARGTEYDFNHAQREWSAPPFDNIGYISSAEALTMPDEELRELFDRADESKYSGDELKAPHFARWLSVVRDRLTEEPAVKDFAA